MGKQILNRREKLLASEIPPEIPDTSTLVKKTDKATASAFGVVKVGDNINVSSGKISVPIGSAATAGVYKVGNGLSVADGVLSATATASGITADVLYTAPATPETMSQLEVTLTHDIADYKLVCVIGNRANTKSAMTLPVIPGFETWMPIINYAGNLVPALINIPEGGGTTITVHCDTPAGMTLYQIIGYK